MKTLARLGRNARVSVNPVFRRNVAFLRLSGGQYGKTAVNKSNSLGDGWKTADDWCQHCSQPIERSVFRWFGTWIAYTLFMALPAYHRHTGRLWRWLLPHAGAYAFSCHDNGACLSPLSHHGERG